MKADELTGCKIPAPISESYGRAVNTRLRERCHWQCASELLIRSGSCNG